MPRKKRQAQPEVNILVSLPELWQFTFERHEVDVNEDLLDPSNTQPILTFGIGLNRFSRERIGVEFQMEVSVQSLLTINIAYRAIFDFEMEGASDEEIEREMRSISRIGAQTLYPFIRESVVSLLQKAGMPPLVPPLINFQEMFNPDEIDIPLPPT